jgi:uncharacterized protein
MDMGGSLEGTAHEAPQAVAVPAFNGDAQWKMARTNSFCRNGRSWRWFVPPQVRRARIMKTINLLTLFLIIIGGINWGLEAMGYNLVEALFGEGTGATRLVYALVGLSALWQLLPFMRALRTGQTRAEAGAASRR